MAEDITKNTPDEDEFNEEEYDTEIYTLEDEDGVEYSFKLLATLENEGNVYKALVEVDENDIDKDQEYVILKVDIDENGEEVLVTVDDDEEFDRIADIFDAEFDALDD